MKKRTGWILGTLILGSFMTLATAVAQETDSNTRGSAVAAIANDDTLATTNTGTETPTPEALDIPMERLVMVFTFILGLIYLTYFGLKRYIGWSRKKTNKERTVGVIDTVPLGGKKYVTVTRIYDRVLVLGVSENAINLLTELNDEKEPTITPETMAKAATTENPAQKDSFMEVLSTLAKKRKKVKANGTVAAGAEDKGSDLL